MAPLAVIEHFDAFTHRHVDVLVRVNILQINEFSLEGMKEACRDGVVPQLPLRLILGSMPCGARSCR
jgi:hypothetical protein